MVDLFFLSSLLLVTVIALSGLGAMVILQHEANAQILEKDPLDQIAIDGNATTLEQIDVAIDPQDGYLPQNGTLTIDTTGANDIDIQSMPSAGQSIVLTNTTATVTSNPVTIGQPPAAAAAAAAQQAAVESCDDEDC